MCLASWAPLQPAVGPLLLMFGLARIDASTTSLLMALEDAATAILAWFVFRENFDRRERTDAYFSMAPFLGALVSVAVLRENVTWALFAAGFLGFTSVYRASGSLPWK